MGDVARRGTAFPHVTIRDRVGSRKLLLDRLGIARLDLLRPMPGSRVHGMT